MAEKTFTIDDMIASVLDKEPQTFKDAFSELMAQKAAQAVIAKKEELAQTVFTQAEEPAEDTDDTDAEEPGTTPEDGTEEQQPNETEDENVNQT